jgi:hypothetical protein
MDLAVKADEIISKKMGIIMIMMYITVRTLRIKERREKVIR